jgi:choline dehydrogenase-like flavoprotein
MRPSYDVVVIGSGYGGGVAASRMARGGQSVCLLELGREKWPGEYPKNLVEALPELQVSGDFTPFDKKGEYIKKGDTQGLYHLVLGQGQNAFIAKGLGGTSLLNANVFLETDRKTLAMDTWPEEIRKSGALSHYYNIAREMLQPEKYPEDYPVLPKLELLQKQADALGLSDNFYRVPQTTRFENGPNNVGVTMQKSTLSGMDATGVNDGSKSSTLVNYLADAWNWGAEIFCDCEVRHIKKHPSGEGYLVFFAWHGSKRSTFKQNFYNDLMWVSAKKFVFLGAGSFGTTEILLRSKKLGLKMSGRVGTHMSGNGDILAFGYNTNFEANAMGRENPSPERPVGPTITGVIDCRDQTNPLDGFVIEEGAVPASLVAGLQGLLAAMPGKIHPNNVGVLEQIRKKVSAVESVVTGPYTPDGSVERTQIYLIMSHDSNQAILSLEHDRPVLKFLGVGRSDHARYLNGILAKATTAVGGTYINSPFFAALGEQEITVHPIGGANMSPDGTGRLGVTTQFGELLTGSGSEIHEGLVVVDGAMIPTALGVNPFATITALAERSVEAVAGKRGIRIDYETKNGVLNLFGPPARSLEAFDDNYLSALEIIKDAQASSKKGVEFTEVMTGYMYVGDDIEDFDTAANAAEGLGSSARIYLSIHAWDTDTLISREDHRAMLTGTFICGGLPGSPFLVLRGEFQLFNDDARSTDTTNVTYNFDMISIHGEKVHFSGYRTVDPSITLSPLDTWKAVSTLYATLTRPDGLVISRGVLNIRPRDFVPELATFSATGRDLWARVQSSGQFLTFFTRQVANVFFAPLTALQWPTATPSGYGIHKKPPSETIEVFASDKVPSTMQVWNPPGDVGGIRGAIPILFIPGAAVDHQIFALPTIETNAVEYFVDSGFQVFIVTHRVGLTPVAEKGYTTFDARLDVRAALEKIRELQGSERPIYVVAHCAGSLALSMGLLDGTIPASWISGITASNVFMNPIFGRVNLWKASLPLSLTNVYGTFLGSWFSCISNWGDGLLQQLLNQVLRFYPVGSSSEICKSVVCHRSELAFGRLWSHKNLNEATHSNLSNFLGGTTMRSLAHLVKMGCNGYVMNNQFESLVTESNIARLKGIPILFFSGSENVTFSPESTSTSYFKLESTFTDGDYERVEFPGRGHLDCWMGTNAVQDVYPTVRTHAERCVFLMNSLFYSRALVQ